ncbi:uncharacterized protein N7482_008212 [Penicillium canariense]|uniref:Uncharacterized protein n=1 Tax=Penicillium canariense TaxID=189055 RepID=A0A9W9HTG8_9EURO|nr:uncharacterized protein N7482_008212 [Penicillium canariense]KAJ5157112.1 hypothetical protein N7482_008212 [Penicillium canariense]
MSDGANPNHRRSHWASALNRTELPKVPKYFENPGSVGGIDRAGGLVATPSYRLEFCGHRPSGRMPSAMGT